jgi:hypothetical protein
MDRLEKPKTGVTEFAPVLLKAMPTAPDPTPLKAIGEKTLTLRTIFHAASGSVMEVNQCDKFMPRIRDYAKEYADFHGKPEQIKRRAERNSARSKMEKAGRVHKGDGRDVDHRDRKTSNNSRSNLRVMSASKNRSRQ